MNETNAASTDAIARFDWIRHHARQRPARVALRTLDASQVWTYAHLDRIVDAWVRTLGENGVSRGDRIAVLALNNPHTLAIHFACARMGAIFVPLNWRLAQQELEYIVGHARAVVIVHDDTHHELGIALASVLGVPCLTFDAADDTAASSGQTVADPAAALSDVVGLMYTSGTTGRPKAAIITHQMVLWHAINIEGPARITRDSTHLALLPFFHTGGLNLYVNPVLHRGGTVIVAEKFDSAAALTAIGDAGQGITHVFAVPTVYQSIADHPNFGSTDVTRLVTAGVGGAACPVPLLERWRDAGRPLAQGWGMTEAGPSGSVADADDPTTPLGSVGRPLLHLGMRLVSAAGEDVVRGEVGEIWLKGPTITPGYWGDEQATADSFTDGWFRTGDAARMDDSDNLFIVDRWKDMYISGGENVYPAEVEAVIADLPWVQSVAVIGIPDETWGEVGQAFVVAQPGHAPSEQDVIEHCGAHLARFKIPRAVVFVPELPMTGSGKIMKRALRAGQ